MGLIIILNPRELYLHNRLYFLIPIKYMISALLILLTFSTSIPLLAAETLTVDEPSSDPLIPLASTAYSLSTSNKTTSELN